MKSKLNSKQGGKLYDMPEPHVINEIIDEAINSVDPHVMTKIRSFVTIPVEDLIRPKRKSRKGQTPRPQNLFVLYRRDMQAKMINCAGARVGSDLPFVSKKASFEWEHVSPDIKIIYETLAELAKTIHEKIYPNYVYRPRKRREKNPNGHSLEDRLNSDGQYYNWDRLRNASINGHEIQFVHENISEVSPGKNAERNPRAINQRHIVSKRVSIGYA